MRARKNKTNYHPQIKLLEDNVFTPVCHSIHEGGVWLWIRGCGYGSGGVHPLDIPPLTHTHPGHTLGTHTPGTHTPPWTHTPPLDTYTPGTHTRLDTPSRGTHTPLPLGLTHPRPRDLHPPTTVNKRAVCILLERFLVNLK